MSMAVMILAGIALLGLLTMIGAGGAAFILGVEGIVTFFNALI